MAQRQFRWHELMEPTRSVEAAELLSQANQINFRQIGSTQKRMEQSLSPLDAGSRRQRHDRDATECHLMKRRRLTSAVRDVPPAAHDPMPLDRWIHPCSRESRRHGPCSCRSACVVLLPRESSINR